MAGGNRSVTIAVILVILALGAFAAAFILLGGYDLIADLFDGGDGPLVVTPGDNDGDTTEPPPAELQLPAGMSEEFALRLWQEQIDSQVNIAKLVDGKIDSFMVTAVAKGAGTASVSIRATFTDGTSGPGVLAAAESGGAWFFQYITGTRTGGQGGLAATVASGTGDAPTSPLPSIDEVDLNVVNTIVAQMIVSQEVIGGLIDGKYTKVEVGNTTESAGTATVDVTLTASDGSSRNGQIVAISKEIDGKKTWFITTFKLS